jgi:tRNA A37 methylthiotransferase MiaB
MNRKVRVEEVQKGIISVKNAGMQAGTFIILGYPGENEKDILDTVKHLKISDPDFYTITIAYPITGTEMYNEVVLFDPSESDWTKRTDRQTDFVRTYPKQYYEYAISFVHREMASYRNWKGRNITQALKHKLFALYWRLKMKQMSTKTDGQFAKRINQPTNEKSHTI